MISCASVIGDVIAVKQEGGLILPWALPWFVEPISYPDKNGALETHLRA